MHEARLLLSLAGLLLLAACTSAPAGSAREAAVPATISSHFTGLLALDDPAEFRAAARSRGMQTVRGGVVLDIQTQGLRAADRARLDLPGLQVRSFRPEYERIAAIAARAAALRAVAELPFVRVVAPAFGTTRDAGGAAD